MTSDSKLFLAWRDGDRAAGAELVGRHYNAIVRFFQTKAGVAADDLVQRTFLTCHEASSGYNGTGSVRAFLFGIARNVLFEHIRGRVRDGRAEPDFNQSSIADLEPGVLTQVNRRAEQRVLVQALALIPVESQMLLELYYWEELPVAELAEVLVIPAGTVKSRLHRARAQLREALDRVPDEPDDPRSVRQMALEWIDQMKGA